MKKTKIALMILACSAALTGCGNEATNLPKIFKENLEYTFDEYSVDYRFDLYDSEGSRWDVKFNDKNGTEQVVRLSSDRYNELFEDVFDTKDEFEKWEFYEFYSDTLGLIGHHEFWNNIASKYFELEYEEEMFMKNDDIFLQYTISPVGVVDTENRIDLIENVISSENGVRLCEEDLGSMVSKDYVATTFEAWIYDGADTEAYVKKVKAVLDDFEKYAPQNYIFTVKDSENEICFSKCKVLSEEIDRSELEEEEIEELTLAKAVKEALGLTDIE